MLPSERLASLGLVLPEAPTPVGSYVPAQRLGDLLRTSGQLPLVGGALHTTGVVGDGPGLVTLEAAAECARIAALNALAALASAAGGLDEIGRITRVVGYIASAPEFTAQPSILNAASDLMTGVFGEAGTHVRSAVGVTALPLGSPVEVEVEALVG